MGQYIGARYVPRFLGTYDATQEYEALDVVDNGMGTSYISKIPTPPGTPLTDADHWALYGASSGAIINLQNQIDDINDDLDILNAATGDIVVIGDSWASFDERATYPDRTDWLYNRVQANSKIHNYAISGAGSASLSDQLTTAKADTTYNSLNVCHIVIVNGANDYITSGPEATFISRLNSLYDTFKDDFPNAAWTVLFDCMSPDSLSGTHTETGCYSYFKSCVDSIKIPIYYLGLYLITPDDFEVSNTNSYHLSSQGGAILGNIFDQIINNKTPSVRRMIAATAANTDFIQSYAFDAGVGSDINLSVIRIFLHTVGNNADMKVELSLQEIPHGNSFTLQHDITRPAVYSKKSFYLDISKWFPSMAYLYKHNNKSIQTIGNVNPSLYSGSFGDKTLSNAIFIFMKESIDFSVICLDLSNI